ncbi:MAG: lysozyme [Novosphingobium sp.]
MAEVQKPAPIEPLGAPAPAGGKARLAALVGTTAAGLMLATVALWEGKSNDPYRDIVNVWTVCYGETRVEMRRYSDAECEEMLADGVGGFAHGVLESNPELRHRPYQLAAATSLSYNIGINAWRGSTAARRFRAGDFAGGCRAMTWWNKAGGKVVRGLQRRREAEFKICMTGLG